MARSPKYYDKTEIKIWTPLIGFEKNDRDKGAKRMLSNVPFTPHSIAAFVFHIDIVLQHEGMDKEVTLPPDVCAYHGSERNGYRERQDWTNLELKKLIANLNKSGTEVYMSIMADFYRNIHHYEWVCDHQELLVDIVDGKGGINLLKRMADGTYFEDLFIDKLCKSMIDYGFAGLHATDLFCPQIVNIAQSDFSTDMMEQFVNHTGIEFPEDILSALGNDSNENKTRRGEWIWQEKRQEWINFNSWRWGVFWKKLAYRLKEINKKVMSIGMYCTAPFENLYLFGLDLRLFEQAGVQELMPNPCPTNVRLGHPEGRDPFYNHVNMMPLISAIVPKEKLYIMLGVRDDTEQWNAIQHAPCSVEKEIFMYGNHKRITSEGIKNCIDGFMMCLGDSLTKDDWLWLKERMDIAFYDDAEEMCSPIMIWSDTAFDNTLPAYINTRRWTLHKYAYETAKRGTLMNAIARIEDLSAVKGNIFVPNFDLLSNSEKEMIAKYDRGAVICTALSGFKPEEWGIKPDICFEDKFANVSSMAFAFGMDLSEEVKEKIMSLCDMDDGKSDYNGNPKDMPEYNEYVLNETIVYSKVTEGFADAVSYLLRNTGKEIFTADKTPLMTVKLKNGKYRVYAFNTMVNHYCYTRISCKKPIKSVKTISDFPVPPAKLLADADEKLIGMTASKKAEGTLYHHFQTRVKPDGMSIYEVELL